MLAMSSADLPLLLIQAATESKSGVFHLPENAQPYVQILLMWIHFLAGITWIGHLYFFNLVNVNLMKALDGPTKGKVIPQLMPRALWWFRWGAVVTVFVGLTYYAMYILAPDARGANSRGANANPWVVLLVWLVIAIVTFAIIFFILRSVDNGWAIAGIIGVLVIIMALGIVKWVDSSIPGASNRAFNIGIGGALGVIMLFNVWGIIWPNQKRIIAWTYDNAEKGTAIPAESAKLARQAFLASRTNTWLSVPMLFLMAASQYFPAFGR
jgi:uncharacterized membrane protein